MLRVVISAFRDFDDQRIAQQAILALYKLDAGALVVSGANAADKRIGLIWKALGGHCQVIEPEFHTGGSPIAALQKRDKKVFQQPVDLCLDFAVGGQQGWMAKLCADSGIKIKTWDSMRIIVDAD